MQYILDSLLETVVSISATAFSVASVLLFLKAKTNVARKMMAYTLLVYALFFIVRLVFLYYHPFFRESFFSFLLDPYLLTIGNIFIIAAFFFPIEVILPGWLTLKRLFYIILPQLILSLVYVGGLLLTGESTEHLRSYRELTASIGHFNVWIRGFFLLAAFIYIGILLSFIFRHESQYQKWRSEFYTDNGNMDISWMRYFELAILLVSIAYFLMLLTANVYAVLVHHLIFLSSFMFLFYKALFHESPYPQGFFQYSLDQKDAAARMDGILPVDLSSDDLSESSFEARLPNYVQTFTTWMETERPYLYKDFKLTDVARVLPLNRSYISRVFNQGLGKNFSEVVRTYRIDYAKRLLRDRNDFTVHYIAEICGFSSDSTFIRSFVKETGLTPSQFRNRK